MTKILQESIRFSLYKNLYTVKPDLDIDIDELYDIIKFGFLRKEIKILRKNSDGETREDMKKSILPVVTLSGLFEKRNESGLKQHSGLIQIDFDNVENYDQFFAKISQDVYTYMAFRSSGGEGVKVIVRIKSSAETHEAQYFALKEYYKSTYDITIKASCKAVSKSMVLSFDPNIYSNKNAHIFTGIAQREDIVNLEKLEKNIELNPTLFNRLKKMRIVFSGKQEIPAFMVFRNKVLAQIVRNRPKTKEELLQIDGIGKHRVTEYGESILRILKQK